MKRPKVVVLNSASVDGRLAMSPDMLLLYGDERWQAIEGSDRFNIFEWLKTTHNTQATLEGSGSFVAGAGLLHRKGNMHAVLVMKFSGINVADQYVIARFQVDCKVC